MALPPPRLPPSSHTAPAFGGAADQHLSHGIQRPGPLGPPPGFFGPVFPHGASRWRLRPAPPGPLGPPLGVFGPPPGLEEGPHIVEAMSLSSHDRFPSPLKMPGEPALVRLRGISPRGASPSLRSEANDAGQQQTIDARLTREVVRAICVLSRPSSLSEEHSNLTEYSCGESTEEERFGVGAAEGGLTDEHRSELEKLSRELSNALAHSDDLLRFESLAEQAALSFTRLDSIASHGDGPRRAVRKAVRCMQNILTLVCCRGLTPEELGHQGVPAPMRAKIATVCIKFMLDEESTIARCGTAKYRLFNDGRKFSRRRRKRSKPRVRPENLALQSGVIST